MFTWHRGDFRSEFTPVPSHGSIFVYMIPPQNIMPARVTPAWVHPSSRTGERISLRYEITQRYHAESGYHVNTKRPPISVWNRSAGLGSACAMFAIWTKRHVNAIRNKVIPVWNSPRCEFSLVNTPLLERTSESWEEITVGIFWPGPFFSFSVFLLSVWPSLTLIDLFPLTQVGSQNCLHMIVKNG